jgi:thymidylate synthase (FAD)
MERFKSEELDKILGKTFNVLDDGFVRVIDYMGNDSAIVQAARVSYGEGTKKVREDRGLIRYLMRHKHTSPFEMCEIKFHLRVPMDIWRQWIRHRTASVNEYSTRYSKAISSQHKTNPEEWRYQSKEAKQGSGGFMEEEIGRYLSKQEEGLHILSKAVYEERLSLGVAREQARKDLPLSTYTEAYWKIDLRNLLHFLELRLNPTAQIEIREYAKIIGYEIVSKWVPLTWEAFLNYNLKAIIFSEEEQKILSLIISNKREEAIKYLLEINFLEEKDGKFFLKSEGKEFEEKIKHLSIKLI